MRRILTLSPFLFALVACTPNKVDKDTHGMGNVSTHIPQSSHTQRIEKTGKLFGDRLVGVESTRSKKSSLAGSEGIGVNAYLWRAALDTLSFMPTTADPFGGYITTDWHTLPLSSNIRYKIHVIVLTHELKPDGLRVSVFKQKKKSENNTWVDLGLDEGLSYKLETLILTRARQLRSADL